MSIKRILKGAMWQSSSREPQSNSSKASLLFLALALSLALACSSSDPSPTGGVASQKVNGRLLISSETGSSLQVIDLQQSILETSSKSFTHSHRLVVSPEGQFAFVVQASGNRIDLLKMGTSAAVATESTTTSDDGHHHKPRYHATAESATESTSSSSNSSVDVVDFSITGEGLKGVVARGQWIAIQFKNKVLAISAEDLENKSNSITESFVKEFASSFPGVAIDEEHIALGANVYNISSGDNVFQSSANLSAHLLVSDNILSATRVSEGIVAYGTDQGVWLIHLHNDPNRSHDSLIAYPSVEEHQIFLAKDHDHEDEGENDHDHEGEDLHEEVMEHLVASTWASRDGLEHCFVHLNHENHSAGIYLFEAGHSEDRWTYLPDTSSANVRPVAMELAKFEEESSTGEHLDQFRLLILMSDGSLRIHDGADEGAFITSIPAVISPVKDFHPNEGNFPGLISGLGKVYVGDPSKKTINQIDLRTYQIDFTWQVSQTPNQLLFLGESNLSETAHDHTH